MKIVVNWDLCESNARCMEVAPAVFEVGDDDKLRVLVEEPPASQLEAVRTAIRRCPRQALRLTD